MRLSFGDFVLDTDMRELRRRTQAVHLSPKAFQLLEILAASRPNAVSKIDLQDRLWPDTHVVEKNLTNLIAEIRDALGDDSSDPMFVRTVHRFGYAFREESVNPDAGDARTTARAARFRLVWADGRVMLHDGVYVLGRDAGLDLFLDSSSVSRRHAQIRIAGSEATVVDLQSKNGTLVGDRRADSPTPLSDGDVIVVGSVRLTFLEVRAGSTETATID